MNKYFLISFLTLFVVSLAGNKLLLDQRDEARDKLAKVEVQIVNTKQAAQTCSDSIKALRFAAEDAAAVAAPKIAESKKQETVRQTKAQVILSTPPSKPGDDCGSAKDSAKAWLEGWKE